MKRFKYFFMGLVLIAGLVGSGYISTADASSTITSTGKAFIPYFCQTDGDVSHFSCSNITDFPINVTVTFYNYDGTILTDDGDSTTGTFKGYQCENYNDNNTDSTLTFQLEPHQTGRFYSFFTPKGIANNGYGVISWSQSGNTLTGLVAQGSYYNKTYESRFSIPINSGLPF